MWKICNGVPLVWSMVFVMTPIYSHVLLGIVRWGMGLIFSPTIAPWSSVTFGYVAVLWKFFLADCKLMLQNLIWKPLEMPPQEYQTNSWCWWFCMWWCHAPLISGIFMWQAFEGILLENDTGVGSVWLLFFVLDRMGTLLLVFDSMCWVVHMCWL